MQPHQEKRIWRRLLVGAVILLAVLVLAGYISRADKPQDPFLREVSEANERGKSWIFNNLLDTGLFVYSFNPETGETSRSNNAIRQLMSSRVLAEESDERKLLRPFHERNLTFLMEDWYQTDQDRAYVLYDNKSKLGANAMLLRVLVASPYYEKYKDEARSLAEGILFLQHDDGSFEPWYAEPGYTYDKDYLLTFYSGEALVALVEYYEKTGDAKWLSAAERSAEFYIDRYVAHLADNYYPAYVPWHTLAYNHLYKLTGEKKYADAIFVMNDKLLELQDTTRFVGRFYNPKTSQYGSPHSSSDAVYTEGLAYAYEVARLVGDDTRAERYKKALELGVRNLIGLQYQGRIPGSRLNQKAYLGAIRVRTDSSWVRVDTTQHAVDAFTKILEVFGDK